MPSQNNSLHISANTLFHFTNSAENLINILRNEFKPNLCLESLNIIGEVTDDEASGHAFPMVCFCDLPISAIKEHLNFYGNYGIGLSKEWEKSKGISPVLYAYPDAPTCNNIAQIAKFMFGLDIKSDGIYKEAVKSFFDLICYIKPYEGKIYRNGSYKNKKFYDEKEWRFVPKLSDFMGSDRETTQVRLSRNEFNNKIKRAQSNSYIQSQINLSFEPNDIKYIFVKTEDEILPMIDAIEQIKLKYDENTVKLLSSRIMTTKQISEDF